MATAVQGHLGASVFGRALLQLVHPLDKGVALRLHVTVDLGVHSRLDGRHVERRWRRWQPLRRSPAVLGGWWAH